MAKREMHPNSLRAHRYNSCKGGVGLSLLHIGNISRLDLFEPGIQELARKIHLDLLQLKARLECSRVIREEEL